MSSPLMFLRNSATRVLQALILLLVSALLLPAQNSGSAQNEPWRQDPPSSTGIEIGKKIPAFSVPDQTGRRRDFDSIKGPKGAAIYFMRSADW